MDRPSPRGGYSTREVATLLGLSQAQIRSCARAGFVAPRLGPRGELLFRGPGHGHRYHQCRDGWIAVAAVSEVLRAQMAAALGGASASRSRTCTPSCRKVSR